jgi:hypothetical protein
MMQVIFPELNLSWAGVWAFLRRNFGTPPISSHGVSSPTLSSGNFSCAKPRFVVELIGMGVAPSRKEGR